jgi:hypothetical protein
LDKGGTALNAAITIANENIAILKQAQHLITDLSDALYTNNQIPPYQSGMGKQIRHLLDFYSALASAAAGKIDYDRSVHHCALIAMILLQQGYTPPKDFGVATSTLIPWQHKGCPESA